jgi:hypothetical protein
MAIAFWVIGAASIASIAASGSASAAPPRPTGTEYFEKHIRPLLVKHCYECHSIRSGEREGGLLLDSRAGWSVGGDNGPAIIPGKLDESLLIQAVRRTNTDSKMPPEKALPARLVARLERWVKMGAPDPRDKTKATEIRRSNPSDPISGREHWSFRPLNVSTPPQTVLTSWPWTGIDLYVLARLKEARLQPAADADRRTLVRRIYFQLIGLPPTPMEMTQILTDQRSDTIERLVDRLLASRQFGERWGRHWLDLARYADSNGLDENFLFREAWRYRNWVIESVNRDTPYDRFLVEQIAGDLLPFSTVEERDRQRIGAGFMVLGPKVLLGNNPKERRMDVADEQLDTIGKTVLGLTLGCARCHDHKFDPVPTADYYALAGILTSTEVMQRRYMLGQQRLMERLVGLGSQGDKANAAYERVWRERPALLAKAKQAQSAVAILKKGDAKELATLPGLAKKHSGTVAADSLNNELTLDQRIAAQKTLLAEILAAAKPRPIPARAMIPRDSSDPADEHIRLAGQFDQLGELVPRGVLRVVGETGIEIPAGQSGRVEFARWLTDIDTGAGRLAARVLANRVWRHLMGRGIVRTADNFGRTGEPPSHPELLDYLANELIASQWSVKKLVRKIILSRTFAINSENSEFNELGRASDPENRLLWRAHRRRLDPESLRDAMLSAAGTLDLTPMQSSVNYLGDQATAVGDNKNRRRTDFPNRSVYLPVIRNDLPELFEVFDFADPHTTTGMRSQTMVATQALFLLNDGSVMDAAEATARRVLSATENAESREGRAGAEAMAEAVVEQLYQRVFSSTSSQVERAEVVRFVRETEARLASAGEAKPKLRAWAIACQALFASSRFQILE